MAVFGRYWQDTACKYPYIRYYAHTKLEIVIFDTFDIRNWKY